jgi:3-dehydroquinate dehydratase-1
MRTIKNSRDLRELPHVVAAVHSGGALHRAVRIHPGEVDFLEIRVDNFALDPAPVLKALPKLRVPLLITVRHPAEGGANRLSLRRRRELFAQFLPWATLMDVELRSWKSLEGTIADARQAGVKIIASAHFFRSMPSASQLQGIVGRAHHAGADISKIAALAPTPGALCRLLTVLEKRQPLPVSVMGMGKFGKISRLLCAQAGSVLNYGYLDRPNASGQWEATVLKQRLAELEESNQ